MVTGKRIGEEDDMLQKEIRPRVPRVQARDGGFLSRGLVDGWLGNRRKEIERKKNIYIYIFFWSRLVKEKYNKLGVESKV